MRPEWLEGKQFADAPESSAAQIVVDRVLAAVALVSKATLLLDFARIVFFDLKMDAGVLVVMVDREETDNPLVFTACGGDFGSESRWFFAWFKEKSEVGARLQLSLFERFTALKRSFPGSWNRAPAVSVSGFGVNTAPSLVSFNFGLEACSWGVFGWTPTRTSLQLLQFGG